MPREKCIGLPVTLGLREKVLAASSNSNHRVFVSYTARDLEAHADIVSDVVRRLEWVAIDHKYWSPSGRPSVSECTSQVESCQILVVLVAHRYGWVPSVDQDGDGEKSITWIEVDHARCHGLEVIPFIVEDDAPWPANLIEGLGDPTSKAQQRLNLFKAQLRQSISGFFSEPVTLNGQLAIALYRAAERIEKQKHPTLDDEPKTTEFSTEEAIVPFYFDADRPPSLSERLEIQLPKRILALDDGGVRSGVALPFLARIERLLQIRYGAPDFRLNDYFDLIGGTGLAAILAVELARGRSVSQLEAVFRQSVDAFYGKKHYWRIFQHLYDTRRLYGLLHELYGDATLSDNDLATGVCVVATDLKNGRIYPFTNHPRLAGRSPLLRDALMASLSLPTLLPPHPVSLHDGEPTLFITGQLSTGQDLSMYLFLLATAPEFPFCWRKGKRRLSLLSIGSGIWPEATSNLSARPFMWTLLPVIISQMSAGLRYQSQALFASLAGDGTGEKSASVLSYRRFNVEFSSMNLEKLTISLPESEIAALQRMNAPANLDQLMTVSDRVADSEITPELFMPSFDIRRPTE